MADDATKHNPHAESLAFVSDQHKVSDYQPMQQTEHITHAPSDLQDAINAHGVTSHKDQFLPQTDAALDLQSGPPKTLIDDTNATTSTLTKPAQGIPLSNFAHAALHSGSGGIGSADNSGVDPLFGSTKESASAMDDDSKMSPQGQDGGDLFGGMMNGTAPEEVNGGDAGGDEMGGNEENQEMEEEKETFLSVWQEQHREQLAAKAKEEREAQDKQLEAAKEELEKFNEQRRLRSESARKDAKARESDLREELNHVFQHGTIWQQVAKLVDLKTDNRKKERFRDLLIRLKNEDEVKVDQ